MRKVFFSFHYVRDCWSVSQIRNSWLLNPYHDAQPFHDKAHWEQIKRSGPTAIKNWIDSQMRGTSVTVVLIGPHTLSRPWVQYEVDQSTKLRKGLLGVTMENMVQANRLPDCWNQYSNYGPFNNTLLSAPVYSWTAHDGRRNLAAWIESAARNA